MNHRVRAIIVDSGNLFLIKRTKQHEEYYVLPGGGIEPGEEAIPALQREILEELGITVSVDEFFTDLRRVNSHHKEEIQSFYLCTQTGGEFGTGNGPEFDPQGTPGRSGSYTPVKIPLSDIPQLAIHPSEIKELIIARLS